MSEAITGGNSTGRPSGRRGGRVVLVVSLTLNLLLVGVIAGRIVHWPWQPHGGPLTVERLTRPLPPQLREPVRAELRARRPEIAGQVASIRAARAEIHAAIAAEPFDPARLQAAFATLRARAQAVREDVETAIIDVVGKLPPDARQALADHY